MCFAYILCLDPGNLITLLFGFFCISTWRVCCCSALFCTFFHPPSGIIHPRYRAMPLPHLSASSFAKRSSKVEICFFNKCRTCFLIHPDLDSTSLAFFPHLVATFTIMRVQSEKPSRDRKQWVFMSQCSKASTVQIAFALFRLSVFTVQCTSNAQQVLLMMI